MRLAGKIIEWNEERGFGFIEPQPSGAKVFFHISAMERGQPRPRGQEAVTYEPTTDARQRPQALQVRYVRAAPHRSQSWTRTLLALVCLAGLVAGCLWRNLPFWVCLPYLGMSAITYAVYAEDKRRAQAGEWRISEANLHLLEFLGGWPGALVAQEWLRHKSQKASYLAAFWIIFALHIAGWIAVLFLGVTPGSLLKQ